MSLPRIKTLHQAQRQNVGSSKDLKVKFRKIALEQSDKEQRKKSITVVRTERLKTLERFTTVQEKREYKNQKIHLNLIQRKLLSGTYDEKKETSTQLTAIKQKRDQMRVEMSLKQKQIERIKLLLDDVKQSINEYLIKKGEHDEKLKELKQRHQAQQIKTDNARDNKMVLENMVKKYQDINLVLIKRCNNIKQHSEQLINTWSLANIQQRQTNQKCSNQENKLYTIIQQSNKQRNERNDQIIKYQQKINKRKDGEVMHVEKSKQYVAQLDNMQYMAAQKEFHHIYDKILPNIFVAKYAKLKMITLMSKYSSIQKFYSVICSYKAFDTENPANFVKRFFEHEPENVQWQEQIKQKQNYLSNLQQNSNRLKKTLQMVQVELDETESTHKSIQHSGILQKEREHIRQLKTECKDIDQKNIRVKSYIFKMLGKLNQKGEKNIYNGTQSTVNNLNLLTKIIRESYKNLA